MTIDEIIELRKQLPGNWQWEKCYELSYISIHTGREFIKKHWALKDKENDNRVCSLGLISHNSFSGVKEFYANDLPVQFVENSLQIVDVLLAEIERLKEANKST